MKAASMNDAYIAVHHRTRNDYDHPDGRHSRESGGAFQQRMLVNPFSMHASEQDGFPLSRE
jgi:hypothetical protein